MNHGVAHAHARAGSSGFRMRLHTHKREGCRERKKEPLTVRFSVARPTLSFFLSCSVSVAAIIVAVVAFTHKVVADVGTSVVNFNNKHQIVTKMGNLLKAGGRKVSDMNSKYHITENIGNAAKSTVDAVRTTNEKYHVTENIGNAVSSTVDKVTDAIDGKTKGGEMPATGVSDVSDMPSVLEMPTSTDAAVYPPTETK